MIADSTASRLKEQELTGKALPPGEGTGDIRHGFVYERVQHITLKSIANNPDITEGMTPRQIDEAIKRHADFEMLYDKPYEDKQTVRVTGPFTVESLSPHRSLAFAGSVDDANRETISEQDAAEDAESPKFEQSILDNLAKEPRLHQGCSARGHPSRGYRLAVHPGLRVRPAGDRRHPG